MAHTFIFMCDAAVYGDVILLSGFQHRVYHIFIEDIRHSDKTVSEFIYVFSDKGRCGKYRCCYRYDQIFAAFFIGFLCLFIVTSTTDINVYLILKYVEFCCKNIIP